MSITNLKLEDLKKVFNYVSEAIVISDDNYNIVLINDSACRKLCLDYNTIYTKKLIDYIPLEQTYKVVESIESNNNDYYEIRLLRESGEEFPALVSGQEMIIENKKYRISTILDVTELKEKEKELLDKSKQQVKKLKTHIISNVNEKTKAINIVKNASIPQIKELQNEIVESTYQKSKLNKKIELLKGENRNLTNEISRHQINGFDFNDIIEMEIAKASAYKFKFSLVKIIINDFEKLKQTLNTQDKLDTILNAIKRQFKTSIKRVDTVYHHKNEEFYIILANANSINITNVVEKLIIPKKMHDTISIDFSYGMAHFFGKDDAKGMMYRCEKNLASYILKQNNEK